MNGRSPNAGLRIVALFEGAKGVLVLAAGFGLLSLIHDDVQGMAEELVRHFHLNPASAYPRIFLQAVAALNSQRLWLLAVAALLYASLRLVEAYGLWRTQQWAKYFGVITGGIYVPIEIYELFQGVTWTKVLILAVNVAVVGYLAWDIRFRKRDSKAGPELPYGRSKARDDS